MELLEKNAAPDKEVVRLNRAFLRLYPYEALQAVVIVNIEDLQGESGEKQDRETLDVLGSDEYFLHRI